MKLKFVTTVNRVTETTLQLSSGIMIAWHHMVCNGLHVRKAYFLERQKSQQVRK